MTNVWIGDFRVNQLQYVQYSNVTSKEEEDQDSVEITEPVSTTSSEPVVVKIGSASYGDNGIKNNRNGDQSGREVKTEDWYLHEKGWVVLRCNEADKREKIAWAMEAACKNNNIGYDQDDRDNTFKDFEKVNFDPSKITEKIDTDCSGLVRVCIAYAYGEYKSDAFDTDFAPQTLVNTGLFTKLTTDRYCTSSDYLVRGDILCTPVKGHMVIVLNDGAKAHEDYLVLGQEHFFIAENTADTTWLESHAASTIETASSNINIIIMLGLIDCINSCTWESMKLDSIADLYIKNINDLVESNSGHNFYVCSVNPVDSDCPSQDVDGKVISAKTINDAIVAFNKKVSEECNAEYIDCYNYLISTGFKTRDGLRYTKDTCMNIKDYIQNQLSTFTYATGIIPRLHQPDFDKEVSEGDIAEGDYWLHINDGGLNDYPRQPPHYKRKGDTLPNCTAWAYGRFYELLGSKPSIKHDNAEGWYPYGTDKDGYERGQDPRPGAIICWEGVGDKAGHVAIVEQVLADGFIITSESGYNSSGYWWVRKRDKNGFYKGSFDEKNQFVASSGYLKKTAGNWGADSTYKFQGFIYCPNTAAIASSVSKDDIRSENSWGVFERDEKMKINAQYICQYFSAKGWTLNAIAALLGNMQHESGLSPSIWEGTTKGSTINADGTHSLNYSALKAYYDNRVKQGMKGRYPGYGLVQWTSYTKLYDWCQDGTANETGKVLPYWDIDSQLARIDWEARHKKQWGIASYNKDYSYKGNKFSEMSFSDFIVSTRDSNWLAACFAFSYEKPASSSSTAEKKLALCTGRGADGEFWYEYLSNFAFTKVQDTSLKVACFKITSCEAPNISASFVVRNGKSYRYTLSRVKDDVEEAISNSDELDTTDGFVEINIKNEAKVIPNCTYKLAIEVTGSSDSVKFNDEITFETPQAYPNSIESISLTCLNKIKDINSKLELSVAKPAITSYWEDKKMSCGYEEQLIINNEIVKIRTINDIKSINKETFTIKDRFDYTCTTGDTVQIGFRVWVYTDTGKPLFDSTVAKTSEAICILNKPILTYIGIT